MPEISPPPPIGTNTASIRPECCRRISTPLAPGPVLVRCIEVIAVQHPFRAEVDHRLDLDLGRRARHHYHGRYAAAARRERHALRVVTRGGADHAPRGDRVRQVRDAVVGAAQLEGKHGLEILALVQHAVAEPPRQARRLLERGFDGDLVDARLENAFDVAFLHADPPADRRLSLQESAPSLWGRSPFCVEKSKRSRSGLASTLSSETAYCARPPRGVPAGTIET